MLTRRVILGSFAMALAACSPPAPEARNERPELVLDPAEVADPTITVRALYERYYSDAPVQFPPLEQQAPWSDEMNRALAAMMVRAEVEEGPILDFDPFVNAQDWELQNVEVRTDGLVAQSHATVRATITNAGYSEDIVYDLVWENNSWRVDNIRNADWDLRAIAAG